MSASQGRPGSRRSSGAGAGADAEAALPAIPATAWAVLGLLSFDRELSGYDVKQWADSILRFFYWSPATSQIYAELRRLEDLGLVVSHVVARDDVRGKRVYAITPAGRAALERWQVETEPEATVLKHGLMLRLWLGHLAPPERLRQQIESQQAVLRAELDAARASAERAAHQPEWAYPAMVARWTCRRIEDELALTDQMLADLDGLDTGGR